MRAFLLTTALALTACASGNDPLTQSTRDAAKGVVDQVVETRLPGVNAKPYTDCIIDNASGLELLQIAKGAITGVNGEITGLVLDIAQRKDTLVCFVKSGSLGKLI